MFCSNCGKEIDEKADVCIYCGVATKNSLIKTNLSNPIDTTQKSKLAAGLLAILIGSLGIHNFYLGYTSKGVIQLLLTIVGWIIVIGPVISAIWALVEGIMILTGSINQDADGNPLRD